MIEKKEFSIKLGSKIKEIRNSKKLSQKALGELIDKDQQHINRLEAGAVNISAYFLAQVAEALNVSIADLINFKD